MAEDILSSWEFRQKITDEVNERLIRKIAYAKARKEANAKNFNGSIRVCQEELLSTKKSASAYYSLASMYYNE
jgi:hypothetical protein